ncbi:MAG: 16S rRNA (adenine(1518)-N(6)/adenine(1519)-N(6))-dimethyltransferase RsmA [Alphaproteobacteria bacterium]|nr:16S rRNA (adenine(1518)-N(6)/adenine(1519)-N(6))-dimethyltransferase RsmA [Alphaproteobacteria bacterium]
MSRVDDLPPLREVIARHGLNAKKELGQNFLFDLNLTGRIARAAGDLSDVTVIEIGPGPGGLTRALLSAGAKRVVAIERDERALPALAELAAVADGRLGVLSADALDADYAALAQGRVKIVANLPYNIATPLLTGWLAAPWPPFYESLTLMFQKEVAERICAAPGSKTYGRLGVLAGWRSAARLLFAISRSAFTPPPNVTSAIVHLVPKPRATEVAVATLEAVTRAAFGQRRKMIRQSLKGLPVSAEELIEAAGLKGTERAEELPVASFLEMARRIEACQQGPHLR